MSYKVEIIDVPLVPKHIVPYGNQVSYYNSAVYSTAIYTPEDTPVKGVIHYFGGTGTMDSFLEGYLVEAFTNAGYKVISNTVASLKQNRDRMWANGYGNVNSPNFLGYYVIDAWMVHNSVSSIDTTSKKFLVGQSKGASAIIAYLAGLTKEKNFSNIVGAYCNGATIASLSNTAWVNPEKTIRTTGDIINWSRKSKVNRRLHYGTQDTYLSPAMLEKLKLMIPEGDKNLEIVTSDRPHVWFNTSKENSDFLVSQVDEMWNKGI